MATIPFDPADTDGIPPRDLDACTACDGLGLVVTGRDPETGKPVDEPCRACDGSGSCWGWVA